MPVLHVKQIKVKLIKLERKGHMLPAFQPTNMITSHPQGLCGAQIKNHQHLKCCGEKI